MTSAWDSEFGHEGPGRPHREVLLGGPESRPITTQLDHGGRRRPEPQPHPVAQRNRYEDRIEFVVAVGAPAGDAQEEIDLGGRERAEQLDHRGGPAPP